MPDTKKNLSEKELKNVSGGAVTDASSGMQGAIKTTTSAAGLKSASKKKGLFAKIFALFRRNGSIEMASSTKTASVKDVALASTEEPTKTAQL